MKVFWSVFVHSVKLPQKRAVFTLNRVGMDITVFYLFLLLAIASIPALVDQKAINDASVLQVHPFFYLIYFFIFYYLILVLVVFGLLSLFAYIGTFITRVLHRKLHYSILWKMFAFASTIPLLLFTCVSFFYPLSYLFLSLATLYIFTILMKIILIYPRRKSI